MKSYEVTLSPRIVESVKKSRDFEQMILSCITRFSRKDWGSVPPDLKETNDEIEETDRAIPPRFSILGLRRPPVCKIFACYPNAKWGTVWIIRDMRCQDGKTPLLAVLRPLEYGKWNGPYSTDFPTEAVG